jgi:hypothetical protein
VTEVNTGLQQLLHRYDSHFKFLLFCFSSTPIISVDPHPQDAHGRPITGCVVLNVMGFAHADTL